jgi:DNA-binding beta-propeller fold protein YncE
MVRTRFAVLALATLFGICLHAQPASSVHLIQTIPLSGMKGHFDHFGFDPKHGRLFATLQAEGAVEVLDGKSGKRIGTITGLGKPHAVLYRADLDRLYITDGSHDHGIVHVVDGRSFQVLKSVDLAPGAEQFGYDSTNHVMYVSNGGHDAASPFGFVSVIDTDKGAKLADIRVETPNLEGVAVEQPGNRVFVNDRLHSQVVVIDREMRTVTGQWQITSAKVNVALALDEANHRLFVGCRSGQIVVFNTDTGKEQATLPIAEGVDDLYFDHVSKRIFAPTGSGGGSLEVYQQRDPNHYDSVAKVASAAEGKNGLYVPQTHRYFVGVPDHDATPISILVYDVR